MLVCIYDGSVYLALKKAGQENFNSIPTCLFFLNADVARLIIPTGRVKEGFAPGPP